MQQPKTATETAVETFATHSDMTEREARVFVLRELRNIRRGDVADRLDISPNTVDNHLTSAKQKARLPNIEDVNRQGPRNTGHAEGVAWEIRFPNGAMVRYVWNRETEEIHEQSIRGDDPHSIHTDHGVGGSEDEVAEYALTWLEQYTQECLDDLDTCRTDMPDQFEALTCHAPTGR